MGYCFLAAGGEGWKTVAKTRGILCHFWILLFSFSPTTMSGVVAHLIRVTGVPLALGGVPPLLLHAGGATLLHGELSAKAETRRLRMFVAFSVNTRALHRPPYDSLTLVFFRPPRIPRILYE